jgi:transposase
LYFYPVSSTSPKTVEQLQSENSELKIALELSEARCRLLEEKLRLQRIKALAPDTEKLSDLQPWLIEPESNESTGEAAAQVPTPAQPPAPKSNKRKHPGRRKLPENLPRVVTEIACGAEQCQCQACGKHMPVIGYDESEVLDVEPAKYFVRVTRREKRACQCENSKVVSPALPARIIEKCSVSDAVMIAILVGKYCDHLPLYRQEAILRRETGVEISRATSTGWMMDIGELLIPVTGGSRRDLLDGGYIQADETGADVQTHDKRGENHHAYLWQYGCPGGETVFDFQMGRGREGPRQFLKDFKGTLQTDGYVAYDRGIGGPGMIHAGCWSHARRGFVDAVKVNSLDMEAVQMVCRMDALFLVDRTAKQHMLDFDQRLAQRNRDSRSWAEEIHQKCQDLSAKVLPQSAMGTAIHYTLAQWPRLMVCFSDGRIELSNNLAENSMRLIALGRKNWLHIGSKQAGPKVAAIYSVVESCRRLAIPVKAYLADILPGLRNKPVSQAANLTPARWAAAHA